MAILKSVRTFHSHRSNALVLERVSGPAAHGVFAGEGGQTYRVLVSPDLFFWTPWSTNTAGTGGLFEFFDGTLPSQTKRFFQVVRP